MNTEPTYGLTPLTPAEQKDTTIKWTVGNPWQAEDVIIRNGILWTSRTIGVDAGGLSQNADRACIEWLRFNVETNSLSYYDRGLIYDSSSSKWHFGNSSLNVNTEGNMVIGFSGSHALSYIACFYAGRLASDPLGYTSAIGLLKEGEAPWTAESGRWGDYSHTSLDPNDGLTIWTIQQYGHVPLLTAGSWGTWISAIKPITP